MPVRPTYPGVYVEEIPSGVRTITGVATSIAAFIDRFKRGLLNHPVQIFSPGDFDREFGGLESLSEASYGIQQFFLNGGTQAWVIRVAGEGTAAATLEILSQSGVTAFHLGAGRIDKPNPGVWGNNLRVRIDPIVLSGQDGFNMTVFLVETQRNQEVVVATESFRNLNMLPGDPHFVRTVINDEFSGSKLVRVLGEDDAATIGPPDALPMVNGTFSGAFEPFPQADVFPATPRLRVSIGTEGDGIATLKGQPASITDAAKMLEAAIRSANPAVPAFAQASVSVIGNRLRILAGPIQPRGPAQVQVGTTAGSELASTLRLLGARNLLGVRSGADVTAFPDDENNQVQITIGNVGPMTLTLESSGADEDTQREATRSSLETQIRGANQAPAFLEARVLIDDGHLVVLGGAPQAPVRFSGVADDETLNNLHLAPEEAIPVSAVVSQELSEVPTIPQAAEAATPEADEEATPEAAEAATPEADEEVTLSLSVGGIRGVEITVGQPEVIDPGPGEVAAVVQAAIRDAHASPAFATARVLAYELPPVDSEQPFHLIIIPGNASDLVVFSGAPSVEDEESGEEQEADDVTVAQLLLDEASGAQANVQVYALGAGAPIPGTGQGPSTPGADGDPPGASAFTQGVSEKEGIFALDDVDLFNLLCIPRAAQVTGEHELNETEARQIMTVAHTYCAERRAFFIADMWSDVNEVPEASGWIDRSDQGGQRNGAVYFPRVFIPDPLNEFRLRAVGASGTLAGLYARTDSTRGVWKAPAGTEASLTGVQGLEYVLTDQENGVLNQMGVNCLRQFPVFGRISWGARTLDGDDQRASEWKYIPVRRTALFIEESLFRGLKWVVFEPNDEPLWAQIRLNVGAFMQGLFRQGAFQGKTAREAYLVKCDSETTTQNDINQGIVNILVGFAPLKPAEFVILKIQQLAGQIQT